jgi:hypothetical protein
MRDVGYWRKCKFFQTKWPVQQYYKVLIIVKPEFFLQTIRVFLFTQAIDRNGSSDYSHESRFLKEQA